jgi:hypothetical protein
MSYRLLLNWREGFMGMFRVRGLRGANVFRTPRGASCGV